MAKKTNTPQDPQEVFTTTVPLIVRGKVLPAGSEFTPDSEEQRNTLLAKGQIESQAPVEASNPED